MSNNDDEPKVGLMRVDPNKKLSDADLELIKERYCAGEIASDIAADFNISAHTIRTYSNRHKWPTPGRARLAETKPQKFSADDPAAILADVWASRKEQSRDQIYHGSKKALQRFFAMSPTPQSFSEAKIASELMNKAIDPDEGNNNNKGNINLAVLTQQGFEPKPTNGRVVNQDNT
jgi:uncharacterized protein YjcR